MYSLTQRTLLKGSSFDRARQCLEAQIHNIRLCFNIFKGTLLQLYAGVDHRARLLRSEVVENVSKRLVLWLDFSLLLHCGR